MKRKFLVAVVVILTLCFSFNFISCTNPCVNDNPQVVEVVSITLSETSINVLEGESYVLTATIFPADATDKSLTWSSSNEFCAQVNNGIITALNAGEVEITAKAQNNVVAKCLVKVLVDKEPYTFTKLYIDTEDAQAITSKDEYVKCSVSATNTQRKDCFSGLTAKIKGRGNSTWSMPKKPYKLKFDEKIDLFGNGKAKTWTLIANYADPSLIRNHMVYALADCFDSLENTTKIHTVDLYLNGQYTGVYLVCEQNETGKNRVDINENLSDVDTGFLIELDSRAPSEGIEGQDYFNMGLNYAIKGPDTSDTAFTSNHFYFIKTYVENAFSSLVSNSFDNVCEYLDIQTFVDAFVIHELFSMVDVGYSSFYLHKDTGGKLKAGPLWDFDISSGNCNYHENAVRTDCLWATSNPWYKRLLSFDEFRVLVKNRLETFDYQEFIDVEINEILKYESAYCKNFEVWNILGTYVWPNPTEIVEIDTWRGQVEYLRQWLTSKLNFMKSEFIDN